MIVLPLGGQDPMTLEAHIRNGALALMSITCPVHGTMTVLEAEVIERAPDHFTVELQACCEQSARLGERAIHQCI